MSLSDIQKKIRNAVIARGTVEDIVTTDRILSNVNNFMQTNNLASSSQIATESFTGRGFSITDTDAINHVDIGDIMQLMTDCKVPATAVEGIAANVWALMGGGSNESGKFFAEQRNSGMVGLHDIVGAKHARDIVSDGSIALEAFGANVDTVSSDARAAISIAIFRGHKSLIDRVFPRSSQDSSIVTYKTPQPEVYDLVASSNSSAAVRYSSEHRKPFIELHRDPELVDTTPKKLVVRKANDNDRPYKLIQDEVLKTGVKANLFDLARISNLVGSDITDYTDLLSEGAKVEALILEITQTDGSDVVTETFELGVTYSISAGYVPSPNNSSDSGDRIAITNVTQVLKDGMLTGEGVASVILTDFVDVGIQARIAFTGQLNIKDSWASANGSVEAKPYVLIDPTADVPANVAAAFEKLTFNIVGYKADVKYSEENLRKTTAAVRINESQKQWEIPVGKSFIAEYSLQQDTPETVMNIITSMIGLGNSSRSLDIVLDQLEKVAQRNIYEDDNPSIPNSEKIQFAFPAGSVCLPRVYVRNLDLENVAVMRETERLSDMHNYVTSHIMAYLSEIDNRSMYSTNLVGGERVIYRVITSTPIKNMLFGIRNYYNHLDDREEAEGESDYRLKLPNGTILEIFATNFRRFENKALFLPIRPAAPEEVTSAVRTMDRGLFVGNYTASNNNSAVRRAVVNSREIPWVTNGVGLILGIDNLDKMLKSFNV